jgi:hypothetical protein
VELRELVEQEDAVVGEADLARSRPRAAADDRGRRRGVMRGADRRPIDEGMRGREHSRDGVDPSRLERLL